MNIYQTIYIYLGIIVSLVAIVEDLYHVSQGGSIKKVSATRHAIYAVADLGKVVLLYVLFLM